MRSTFKKIVILLTLILLVGCGDLKKWYYCGYGQKSAEDKNYSSALGFLNQCLELTSLLPEQTAFYLQTRAWTYFSLHEVDRAIQDQEESFKLVQPAQYKEFINYGAYLRVAGKALESIDPLLMAKKLEEQAGHVSMMTQYNLGWALHDIGRFEESISAYSEGLKDQPDYPFAYFRRGLAYDKLGQVKMAEADFGEFVAIFEDTDFEFNEKFQTELNDMSSRYPELKILLKEEA